MPAPLLILCPMRSFSSVVCAMLGQHPQAYGLPEVNLFIADGVGELLRIHAPRPHGMHGLLRALAQIEAGEQTDASVAAARAWLEARTEWSTKQVFDHILEGVAPRLAIDKTPRTVLRPECLERAYAMYPDASFLHLTRHPRSTGQSLLNNLKRNADWGGTFKADQVDPQSIWVRAHTHITQFAATLPEGQCLRIKGEDLLSDPALYLPQIAEWLGLDASAAAVDAMLHPERSPYACYGPEQAKLGNDPEFLEKPEFRAKRITEPALGGALEWAPDREFDKPTVKLARELGYA